jgi:hypothetical protein
MADAYAIEQFRFPDATERALAVRDDQPAYFPEAHDLARMGFNIRSVALVLTHGTMSVDAFAQMAENVELGHTPVDYANRVLYGLRPVTERSIADFDDEDVIRGFGLDVDAFITCRGRVISDEQVGELVDSLCLGADVGDINTALLCMAEDVSARRLAA